MAAKPGGGPGRPSKGGKMLQVRCDDDLLRALDAEAKKRTSKGQTVSRSDVVRVILWEGLGS